MSARLSAEFWVAAYRARLAQANIPAYVTAKGDATAGAVMVKCATLDGAARLYGRSFDAEGRRVWTVVAEGEERAVDEAAARQRGYDPDLWLIEIEDRAGRTLLDEPGLD
ncbi:MAG: DUF1491 family protein [Rhodobacteraceae bacterium]|nr:MAG: DUF1491 family protein [Paracoccaceae bacterium]